MINARWIAWALVASAGTAACSGGSDGAGAAPATAGSGGSAGVAGGGDGGVGGTSIATGRGDVGGATAGAAGAAGAAVATGRLRLAHFASGVASGTRLCATPVDGGASVDLTAALGDGLPFAHVSAYVAVPAATYQLTTVAAGEDCSGEAIAGASGVAVAAGGNQTAILTGDPSTGDAHAPRLRVLLDEAASASIRMRMVAATEGASALSLGLYDGGTFAKVFASVTAVDGLGVAASSDAGSLPVDEQGYAATPLALGPKTIVELRSAASGAAYGAWTSPIPLSPGNVATLFTYGTLAVDAQGNGAGLSAVLCLDGNQELGLTSCGPLAAAVTPPPRPVVRVAHVSPASSAAAIDVCVKPSSYPSWSADDSQAIVQGIAYRQVTSDLAATRLPADSYDVKVLAHASSVDCSQPALDPSLSRTAWTLDATADATLAVTGIAADGAHHFALATLSNVDTTGEKADASVRFVHAVAGASNVDAGRVGEPPVWADVPYGSAASYQPAAFVTGDRLGLSLGTQAAYDLASLPLALAQATTNGAVYTLWAIGDESVGSKNGAPVSLMLCEAAPAPSGPLLPCTVLPLAAP